MTFHPPPEPRYHPIMPNGKTSLRWWHRLLGLEDPAAPDPSGPARNQVRRLELQFAGPIVIQEPSPAELEAEIRALPPGRQSWATLSRSSSDFVTVTGSAEEGFCVEYEAGTRDNHQRLALPLTIDQTVHLLLAYARRVDDAWYYGYQWQHLPISEVDLRKAPQVYAGSVLNNPEHRWYRKPPLQGSGGAVT